MELNEIISGEILNPSIDLGSDYAEVFLDGLLGEGALQEIPVIKTLISAGKIAMAVKDRHFATKLIAFLRELKVGEINSEKNREFQTKM